LFLFWIGKTMFSGTAQKLIWTTGIVLFVVALSVVAWQQDARTTASSPTMRGSEIFASYCSRCHGSDGYGVDGRANLRKRTHIWSAHPDSVLRVLVFGAAASDDYQGATRGAMPPMPYNDKDIASTAMYLLETFGTRTVALSAADVDRIRKEYRKATLQRLREKKGK